jgi:hypothetical protein
MPPKKDKKTTDQYHLTKEDVGKDNKSLQVHISLFFVPWLRIEIGII